MQAEEPGCRDWRDKAEEDSLKSPLTEPHL